MAEKTARFFVETYLKHIIGILVEQQPSKIGQHERSCVEESLALAVIIIAKDLQIQQTRNGECSLLDVLALVFNRKKAYYKGSKGWNVNNLNGMPEVRLRMIENFRAEGGFAALAAYLVSRIPTPMFPSLELLHQILSAIADVVPFRANPNDARIQGMDDDAVLVGRAAMNYISSMSDETIRMFQTDMLNTVRFDLQRIFDRLVTVKREECYQFYSFWRNLVLLLINSKSLPLRLFGWEQLKELIDASQEHRPPPKAFDVSCAGVVFVNGRYTFAGITTPDGYAEKGVEISYERRVQPTEKEGAGKNLTLFRCTMRSQQKWWFLSEADEDQPGTDRDIDYYQHKSKEHEETEPPPEGWLTCRNSGIEPPPRLKGVGLMVPEGQEYNTLEHQLAKWAIDNKIVELVFGASLHREVVHRSIPFIEFLALMCTRDRTQAGAPVTRPGPDAYCLQESHLLLAWKTCTGKSDTAVSNEIYHLLVSILPSLPNTLAIPLLQAVQQSLNSSMVEAAEFCSCIATHTPNDSLTSEEVRSVILDLMWDVLTHPDASSLKSYDVLKRYVANELRSEPLGRKHREKFLQSCTQSLTSNVLEQSPGIDEMQALRMVKLTQFVLEACPREQTEEIVTLNKGALASLVFSELTAFLSRRQKQLAIAPRKVCFESSLQDEAPNICLTLALLHFQTFHLEASDLSALSDRLRILRCVYGISESVRLSIIQLQHLWRLCIIPADREELVAFIASASTFTGTPVVFPQPQHPEVPSPSDGLTAAFSDEVRISAFVDLMCSETMDWDVMGKRAYQSFRLLFKRLRQTPNASTGSSLNALWRICLTTGDESVALIAMKDLLGVYSAAEALSRTNNAWSSGPPRAGAEAMQTDDDDDFGARVFECLQKVKRGLDVRDPAAERSAERCLRILNAAVGQEGNSGRSVTMSAIDALNSLPKEYTLSDVVGRLPHGMRGQSGYRRIGIMAKRTAIHAQAQDGQTVRQASPMRFSIDVHPLETLGSVKSKVAQHCQCRVSSVKPITASGRLAGTGNRDSAGDSSQMSFNNVPNDSTVDQLGIAHGCEMVFVLADRQSQAPIPVQPKPPNRKASVLDLNDIFSNHRDGFADKMFQTLLSVLEALPWHTPLPKTANQLDPHQLVWDLLLAMPTNGGVAEKVRSTAGVSSDDAPMSDSLEWLSLLDKRNYQRSVYVLQTIDSFLQPAPEILTSLSQPRQNELDSEMRADAIAFRRGFIESGGFDAVVAFFANSGFENVQSQKRMGDASALRILKCCLFGNYRFNAPQENLSAGVLDEMGVRSFESLSSAEGLLRSLTAMVVADDGISTSTISDVMKFLRLLFMSHKTTEAFVSLPDRMAEKFLISLLLWEGGPEASRTNSAVGTSSKVRKNMHDLILSIPLLAKHALPWLIGALDVIDVNSDATADYFDVMRKLVCADDEISRTTGMSMKASVKELQALGTAVCKKLASCPRPTSDSSVVDAATGVLCGCLKLLRALVDTGGGNALSVGTDTLLRDFDVSRWSEEVIARPGALPSPSKSKLRRSDKVLIDMMGAIFDGFLCPGGSSSVVSICCDKESRQLGFEAVAAAARSCSGSEGYIALVKRVNGIVSDAAPFLRHRWGHVGSGDEGHRRTSLRNPSKYSGLRNQGCTCYMNSFLQQLFMMNDLRKKMCAAPLPERLRSSGGAAGKGLELVSKRVSLQWDTGVSYEAIVLDYDSVTGMHTIRYVPLPPTAVGGATQLLSSEDLAKIPAGFPDEFILSEGRPGKETGVFEIVSSKPGSAGESTSEIANDDGEFDDTIKESEDEARARHLFEEVQRTFIHLDEGSRGRCFDPRAFVEACACLKLEFDVWQQNDASEFAMKLLDRMETALKRWAPDHFRYLEHSFGLKQTKQKVCKECGLKTNREENLMSIDCQIRGKTDIQEALQTMCEVEYMEGNNKVFCDRCKTNTDTVLRTAISALPDMLVLSLKRFDLDYNTFETVKLNSRCAFGQTLNMKRYTLDGVEAVEKAVSRDVTDGTDPMDTDDDDHLADPLNTLPDVDYDYKLAGVLVHAGVAQGGHYYSFIRDRSNTDSDEDKWYKFDDEDVTPFDPSLIEVECFGGKVKKETKWPNGQVHTVESEQFANALMLFYEKVKKSAMPEQEGSDDGNGETIERKLADMKVAKTSGYDAFEPDVRRSNSTHKWQSFLFDSEFQTFLKGLLGLCRLSRKHKPQGLQGADGATSAIVDMMLTFVFDVFLYSADKANLGVWVSMLSGTLSVDLESSRLFVRKLAGKTRAVSANWLRTYVADCSDQESRQAAVTIFACALRSCASIEEEQSLLLLWQGAWKQQMLAFKLNLGKVALPTKLEGSSKALEDVRTLGTSRSSSIGVVISYINVLLEAAPRTWRINSELFTLIRDIAIVDGEHGGALLRAGLNETHVPERMICLVTRDKAPGFLRCSFPGASMSYELVDSQTRQESSPSSHMLSMGSTHVMANDVNNRGSAGGSLVASEYVTLFEALGALNGMKGLILAPLVEETVEQTRGRATFVLTENASKALSIIFHESCASGGSGMSQHDIEAYLHRCGLDRSPVPTQKILDILTKYPSTNGSGSRSGVSSLSLEGFLAYYRDTAQTNEARVRSDLHTFGFRPDLSRRPSEARLERLDASLVLRPTEESVAIDASALLLAGDESANLSELALLGLDVFELHACAYSASQPLAEYLLASTSMDRDVTDLITNTQRAIYRAPCAWDRNEMWATATMIFRVLVSIQDSFQNARISSIMANSKTGCDQDIGLLLAAKVLAANRSGQAFSNDMQYTYDRYVELLKELMKMKPVAAWMFENRPLWSWMERDLTSSDDTPPQHRSDLSGRREGNVVGNPRSDIDMHGIIDSEDDDDDEDSRMYDDAQRCREGDEKVIVQGAGSDVINGVYTRDGTFDYAGKYIKKGIWKGDEETFSLFRCNVSNNSKHWYISIVPVGVRPGTSTDIDFYTAPATLRSGDFPPAVGWTKVNEGEDPCPAVEVKDDDQIGEQPEGRIPS